MFLPRLYHRKKRGVKEEAQVVVEDMEEGGEAQVVVEEAVSMEAEREAETVEVGVVGRDLHEQH